MESWYIAGWSKYSRMALNFALQELKIYYININELRGEEGKEKEGSPFYFVFIVTTVPVRWSNLNV